MIAGSTQIVNKLGSVLFVVCLRLSVRLCSNSIFLQWLGVLTTLGPVVQTEWLRSGLKYLTILHDNPKPSTGKDVMVI